MHKDVKNEREPEKNDNDQHHHLSKDGNIESNWGTDAFAGEHAVDSGPNDEFVMKKVGDTLGGVDMVSNSGDAFDRTEKRKGKAHADKGGGARVKEKEQSSSTTQQEDGERVKGSRRFHAKVVPVNRSARENATDLVSKPLFHI